MFPPLPALKMNKIIIIQMPPPICTQKKWVQQKRVEISVCCPTVFCIFSYSPSPLVSRKVVFFANIAFLPAHKKTKFCIYSKTPPSYFTKKAVSTTKVRNFGLLPLSILYFFIIGGGSLPLVSRQVGFFANIAVVPAH